jgi:hypothetical protein
MWKFSAKPKKVVLESGYRSKFEERIAKQLEEADVSFEYEPEKLNYIVPARAATYRYDFRLPNDIRVEAKGRFRTASERQKLILVKQAYPEMDLRLLFQNANLPIYKGSKTTYAEWADSHGFIWAEKKVPDEWIKEAKRKRTSVRH